MFKQIILPLLGVMAFVVLVGVLLQRTSGINAPAPSKEASDDKIVIIADNTISVEIADTPDLRAKGLSGRTVLDTDSGMLFVFNDQDVTPVFWMKDTLIPLDIIWIKDGAIVKIDANIEAPTSGTPDDKLTKYSSGQPVDYVLEVNAGYTSGKGISVGDLVDLSKI